MNRPAIVLVRPQLGENIGAVARAMLNFGLDDLRLVSPRDGWPNPTAWPSAAGAGRVLDEARLFPDVASAVADCAQVVATTVRRRGLVKPVVDAEGAAALVHGERGKSAYLFGPERSGLETDDVALARTILTVPINPEFGSLNLAQAVILAAYEWSKPLAAREDAPLMQPPRLDDAPPAPQEALDGLVEAMRNALDRRDYFQPPQRTGATMRSLRTLLTKPGWSEKEVQMMRGIVTALDRGKRGG